MYLVLVLRVLAGRPTIYQHRPERCLVFNADGLYEVPFTKLGVDAEAQFYVAISSQYWCMIGRNKFVTDSDVPFQLSTLRVVRRGSLPTAERTIRRKPSKATIYIYRIIHKVVSPSPLYINVHEK
jgi:hypothetical protein